MNLQVITPICGNCKMQCPYCIASAHQHGNKFKDLYRENRDEYIAKLKQNFETHDWDTIIVTGTAEPMQEPETLKDIVKLLKEVKNPKTKIELQTRFHSVPNDIAREFDVVSRSIDNPDQLGSLKLTAANIDRFVIILTDAFNGYSFRQLMSESGFIPPQITFKTLHVDDAQTTPQSQWVKEHSCDIETCNRLKQEITCPVTTFQLSVRWDDNCMAADNRYVALRTDGDLYKSWDDSKPSEVIVPKISSRLNDFKSNDGKTDNNISVIVEQKLRYFKELELMVK
ncbi:MAG: hypothetical protein LBM38_00625 [Clostridiales bacterium]|jgi:organic radical activating enzyme|nr:hypothetical protein [Clostridiales bacterium]